MTSKDLALTILAASAVACGAPAASGPSAVNSGEPGAAAQPSAAEREDQLFSFTEQALTGAYFHPDALGQPEISWTLPGSHTLVEQRKIFARAKGAARDAEGDGLAALLWTQATPEGRVEARKLLGELAKEPGASADVLEKSALLELGLGNPAGAAALFEQLGKQVGPGDPGARWLAYAAFIHLREGENDKARALVGDLDAANRPEVAYTQAWVKLRAGDLEGARAKIVEAAKTWSAESSSWPALLPEVMLISARAGADAAPTAELVARGGDKASAAYTKLLGGLADAYLSAGEYDQRGAALELRGVATPTPDVLASVHFQQSDVHYRMNRPEQATKSLLDAWTLVVTAGNALPDKTRGTIAGRMFELAALYHRVYAASYDKRYGDAAKNLFSAYVGVTPPPQYVDDAKQRAQSLAQLMAADHAGQGVADKDEVGHRLFARKEQVIACYERYLQVDPKLAGKLQLTFDIALDGTIPSVTSSVATDGPGASAGLPAVAACVIGRVKTWTFPRRGKAGTTRVIYPMSFAPSNK